MCCCLPARYLVSFMGFLGLLLSVGFRSVFTLVLTHIDKTDDSATSKYLFQKIKCIAYGTRNDWSVNWGPRHVFLIHTTFFLTNLIVQLPGGLLAAKFPPKRLVGLMILASSILFVLLPELAKVHIAFVYVIRGLQGLAEGGTLPCMAGVISVWAPRSERTRLFTIAFAGAYLSPAVGFITSGLAMCLISWESIIYIYGALGVIWFLLWDWLVYDTPDACPNMSQREKDIFREQGMMLRRRSTNESVSVPWGRLLSSPPVLAIFAAAVCFNWIFSMCITQQPVYFKDAFHLNSADIGLLSAAPPVAMTVVVLFSGIFFDKLISGEYVSRTVGRKLAQTIGFGTEAVCIIVLYFVNEWRPALALLCIGVGFSGTAISGYLVNSIDLSPQYASLITGVARCGTVGAVLSNIVASQCVNSHTIQEWKNLWLAAGILHLVGVIVYDVFASGKIQPWDPSQSRTASFRVNEDGNMGPAGAPLSPEEYDPLLPNGGRRRRAEDRTDFETSLEDSLFIG